MENVKKSVLIADADSDFIDNMTNILEKSGYSVIGTAEDGIDAVSFCTEKSPEIVFLKNNLKFVDGIKASLCLREKGYKGLVIIVSDDYSSELMQKASAAGADGVITKPVTEKFLVPWLFTKLKRTVEKRELFDEKTKLLSELENKRLESEAIGITASSMKISIVEAKGLLEKKAQAKNMSVAEIAKLIAGGTDNQ